MGEEKFTFFSRGFLGQWYRSYFEVEGIKYSCAEQFMMAEKARLFGDEEIEKLILNEIKPSEQKALGRMVKGFDLNTWNQYAKGIVHVGNYHKFTQNPELFKNLIATSGTTLVEASPWDKIWGIGLDESDPRALKRETWLGTNWLGEVLTDLREQLILDEWFNNVMEK